MTLFFGALLRAGLFFAVDLLAAAFLPPLLFALERDFVERLGFGDLLLEDLRTGDFFAADFFAGFDAFDDFEDLEDFDGFDALEDFFDDFADFEDFFDDFEDLPEDFFDDFFEAAIRFSCSPVSVWVALPGAGIQAAWQLGC